MVDDNEGVVKPVPVPNKLPPVRASYQDSVAEPVDDALKLTVPDPHLDAAVTDITGAALMVAVMEVFEDVVQPFNVASTLYTVVADNDGVV